MFIIFNYFTNLYYINNTKKTVEYYSTVYVPVTVQFSNYIFKDLLHLYKLKDTLRNEGLSDYQELLYFKGSNTNHSILLTRN